MPAAPSCECGACDRCKSRAYAAKSRAKRKGWRGGRPWLDRAKIAASSAPVTPVDPDALAYLSELRALAGPGAVVGIGAYGVMIDTTTSRRTWPALAACLTELTMPATDVATPDEETRKPA